MITYDKLQNNTYAISERETIILENNKMPLQIKDVNNDSILCLKNDLNKELYVSIKDNRCEIPKDFFHNATKIILSILSKKNSYSCEPLKVNNIDGKIIVSPFMIDIPKKIIALENEIFKINEYCEKIDLQGLKINELTKEIIDIKAIIKELIERITADEEIILNPFTK